MRPRRWGRRCARAFCSTCRFALPRTGWRRAARPFWPATVRAVRRATGGEHRERGGAGTPHPAAGRGQRAGGGRRGGDGGLCGDRRRRTAARCGAGGGGGGARGLFVRRAGALCRGPAGGEPRDLSGRRSGERAAGRSAGAMVSGTMAPDWLREELVTLAWCWRLSRRDGVVIGLTSHDRDLMVGGLGDRKSTRLNSSH